MKKTINKFDYPTAVSHTYKMYNPQNNKIPQSQTQKQKFKEVIKRQKDIERQRVKDQQSRKKKLEQHQHKLKIQNQLQKKKKQLEELEKAKLQAFQQQKRNHELELIKIEQNKIKKLEQQQKMKENQYKAQNRFFQALQRLQLQKEQKNIKQRQAQYRRKIIEQNQKVQRQKAIKYREFIKQKQKQIEQPQKRTFQFFKKPLGETAYAIVDYSKTRFHNPQIIIASEVQQKTSLWKAEEQQQKKKQLQLEKKKKKQENIRKSFQRGQQALEKIKRQKQYEKYQKETEQTNKKYNLARIQAGKRDQFIGIKPATLTQMEANKKIRGQQEFQKLFLKSNPQIFNRLATKYQIVQAKLKQQKSIEKPQYSYVPKRTCSNEAVISHGKYSFQQEGIEDLTTVKKDNPYQIHNVQQVEQPEQSVRQVQHKLSQMNVVKEYQNRRLNRPDQLNYSQSEESIV